VAPRVAPMGPLRLAVEAPRMRGAAERAARNTAGVEAPARQTQRPAELTQPTVA